MLNIAPFEQRRTIMKDFQMLLGRISAETCLKCIILIVNPQITKRWGLRLQIPLTLAAGGSFSARWRYFLGIKLRHFCVFLENDKKDLQQNFQDLGENTCSL